MEHIETVLETGFTPGLKFTSLVGKFKINFNDGPQFAHQKRRVGKFETDGSLQFAQLVEQIKTVLETSCMPGLKFTSLVGKIKIDIKGGPQFAHKKDESANSRQMAVFNLPTWWNISRLF